MAQGDVIDRLVGIEPGSHLDTIRTTRPQTRDNAQASFDALFRPVETGDVSLEERCALALFVSGLHGSEPAGAFYAGLLEADPEKGGLVDKVRSEIRLAAAEGPAGHYPEGPLRPESTDGPTYRVGADRRTGLGARLSAAFDHAHMLVYRPREAAPEALQVLLQAGWTTTGIVTISQIVAFLAFQLRVVSGLRALAAAPRS
ncbi:CMD domain protein [uncultured Enterovirga sp.]|uniref:CMD domain protein n=1 Tax=uncultured Enterovirga sp. TaxID=2026352 RepID=UPI0035CC7D42